MFIKIENGLPLGSPLVDQNLKYLFPHIDFSSIVTSEMVEPLGYAIYEFSQMPTKIRYKKIEEHQPILNITNKIWYQNWQQVDKTPEECLQEDKEQEYLVRMQRNFILDNTDWTQIADVSLSDEAKQNYKNYRQALRDITTQQGFPWEIVWPSPKDFNIEV